MPYSALLDDYARFLHEHRGVRPSTVEQHRAAVRPFIETLCPEGTAEAVGRLTPAAVNDFVTAHAGGLSRAGRKALCTAVRSFLRFLWLRGQLARDLVPCVPVIPSWRLDRVPRALAWEDVQKTLAVIDRSTPKGRRDYALLLLLATYGTRAGQVRALRLDDLDWRHETLRVRAAKGGRDVVLPLHPAVGEALVDYLRHGRPSCACREIFLRTRAPMGPLRSNLYSLIARHARRAGVTAATVGAHAWRHACATRMLAGGQSIKTIRDVLGHRSVETTFIYTKVDIERLRACALDWPAVAS